MVIISRNYIPMPLYKELRVTLFTIFYSFGLCFFNDGALIVNGFSEREEKILKAFTKRYISLD